MSPNLEKKLKEKYSHLFTYKDLSNDYEIFHHEDGWYNLLDCLLLSISLIMKKHPAKYHLTNQEFDNEVKVSIRYVKEKFGTLSFSVENPTNEIYSLIDFAQAISSHTCELCGSPGNLKNYHGRIQVRCRSCEEKKAA